MFKLIVLIWAILGLSVSHAQENISSEEWQHLLGLSYNGTTTITFPNATAYDSGSGSFQSFEAEYEFGPAFGLIYEARKSKKNSWGYGLGVEYTLDREAESVTVSSGGSSITFNAQGDKATFTSLQLFWNAIYQWENFYIPFGLSYTSIQYDYKDVELNGGFGFNFGVGWQFGDNAYLELVRKITLVEYDNVDTSGDLNTGVLATTALQFKYNFF